VNEVLKTIGDLGLVPVVAINDAAHAVPLARALLAGGLPVAEITFRTAAAEEAIRRIAGEVPEVLVGAGTVLTPEQVDKAVAAGARYIVSPGTTPAVVRRCQEKGVPVTPGIASPSDIEVALGLGLDIVKFFPAEAVGGLKALKAMAAPYGMVKFIPTGGIDAGNVTDYLAFAKVHACGGSWMVKTDTIAAGRFDEIERLVREAVATTLGFSLAHVGINTADDTESMAVAETIAGLFALPVKPGNSSTFAGTMVEVMKGAGPGSRGHFAVATNSIPRAVAHLARHGVAVDMSTAKGPEGGPLKAVYLEGEVGGFAIHLLQK
jgi:2-dehydro-3-deoxyphosphogluconate aldolase/(4S)-4-hydroxy-2-oxoglutarate aldolase